jgi:hypothetical protein
LLKTKAYLSDALVEHQALTADARIPASHSLSCRARRAAVVRSAQFGVMYHLVFWPKIKEVVGFC